MLNLEFVNDNDNVVMNGSIFIIGDHGKLVQVFWNLLSNALKYTSTGGEINIRISSVYIDSNTTTCTTTISGTTTNKNIIQVTSDKMRTGNNNNTNNDNNNNSNNRRNTTYSLLHVLTKTQSWRNARIRGEEDDIIMSNLERSSGGGGQSPLPPNTLWIEVQDTGRGISPEDQRRLFKEIVQFNPGELQDGKGSGLGLWILHQIMTLHGGNLSVHSEGIGYGSTFTIEIPLCFETNSCVYIEDVKCSSLQIKSSLRADKNISPNMFSNKEMVDMDVINSPYITNNIGIIEEKMRSISILVSTHSTYNDNNNENKKQMETGEDKAKPSTNAVCERVLIVDGVAMNRKMTKRLLKDRWTDMSEAVDVVDAVNMVEAAIQNGHPYSIILMDFEMSNMDGPTAMSHIRRLLGDRRCHIIGVTSNVLPQDVQHFLSQGADRVLIKPMKLPQLN